MYGHQRERIPDLLESPNSRRDLRNSRLSNDHLKRYETAMMKYDRLSPHRRRRLFNNARIDYQYHNFQGYSSSDECLTRNKSKSTSSIDTQSVNNILDEFEDLNYRKSSDLSDFDVNNFEISNFEEMLNLQKHQAAEKQNSRMSRSHHQISRSQHYPASPTKVSRQTQVQQRSRDRNKDGEKKLLAEENSRHERKNSAPAFQNPEVRASIRSAKAPPEVLLRKGEVQKRVDEWLSQTRSQNCAGFTKESRGLTRSNSSAEQKSHRRLRQQELRSRRTQLQASSSYDDLTTHESFKTERYQAAESPKVSVAVNTSRGSYRQYLALRNKVRMQKQQQENANQENVKTNVIHRSRDPSPATTRMNYTRTDAVNLSFRSSPAKRQESLDQDHYQQPQQQHQQQQPQQHYHQQHLWTSEGTNQINVRSKTARARQQMENRISSLVKARHEMSTSEMAANATASAFNRRSSFKRESTRSSSKYTTTNASPSKNVEDSNAAAAPETSQDQVADVLPLTRSIEQDSAGKVLESNTPTESSSDRSQEIYSSVSARVRAFQGRSEHRMSKSKSLKGSNVLIDTRSKSQTSPTKNDIAPFKEGERNQSTFKPNASTYSQPNEFVKKERDVDATTKYVEKIYETTLQPEVIHADNLESVFKPGRTNFVYGESALEDTATNTSESRRTNDCTKRITSNSQKSDLETKSPEKPINHCLKLLQRSPSFRLRRSHHVKKENDCYMAPSNNKQMITNDQTQLTQSFEKISTPPQENTVESKMTSKEQLASREKLDPSSYEARSTLKLNSSKIANGLIENEKSEPKNNSIKEDVYGTRQSITGSDHSKNGSVSSSLSKEHSNGTLREKSEDGAVIKEVLVKNLQFKQDVPSCTPPTPPPRNYFEPSRRQESGLIVELSPLRSKLPLNYNSVLNDDYANLHARAYQQEQQKEYEKIYVTKEEIERRKLMDLLKKGEFELVKMVSSI